MWRTRHSDWLVHLQMKARGEERYDFGNNMLGYGICFILPMLVSTHIHRYIHRYTHRYIH